eukprot:5641016-Pyramimonas_sp.AAC.1
MAPPPAPPPRAARGEAAGSRASGALAVAPAGRSGAAAAPRPSGWQSAHTSDGSRRPVTPPRAKRPRTAADYATRWRHHFEGSQWAQGIGATTTSAGCTPRRTTMSSSISASCSTTSVSATGPRGRLGQRTSPVPLELTATARAPALST